MDNKKELRVSLGLLNRNLIGGESPFFGPRQPFRLRPSLPVLAQKVADTVENRNVVSAAMLMRYYMLIGKWELPS